MAGAWADWQHAAPSGVDIGHVNDTGQGANLGHLTGPTWAEQQAELQAQIDAANAAKADHQKEISDQAKKNQEAYYGEFAQNTKIADQMTDSLANMQIVQANRSGDRAWFDSLRKLGSAGNAIASAAGNGVNGSGLASLRNVLDLQDDIGDTDVYDALTKNIEAIENERFGTKAESRNSLNQYASQVGSQLDSIGLDLAAQLANLGTHTQDLFEGVDPHSDFWKKHVLPALKMEDVGYMRTDKNFRSKAPNNQHGNNANAGSVNPSYSQMMEAGYAGR